MSLEHIQHVNLMILTIEFAHVFTCYLILPTILLLNLSDFCYNRSIPQERKFSLNRFLANAVILCPLKAPEILGFLVFSGVIKWEH